VTEKDNWLAYINGEAEYQYREHWHKCLWQRHTPMLQIIDYGWGAGFDIQQTLHECVASGYSECVAYPLLVKRWKWWDDGLEHYEQQFKQIDETLESIQWNYGGIE
jgi:hypothetical protein